MSESQVRLIMMIVNVLVGAGDIYFAIHHFKCKQYFRFGMWVMFAIVSILQLIQVMFVY